MATQSKVAGNFANQAAVLITESAANTQTSSKFAFPFSIMDKMGLIISRIEYFFNSPGVLDSANDSTVLGLTIASTVTDLTSAADPLIIDTCNMQRIDTGTAASASLIIKPYSKDLSQLPGGGILVAPNPLYGMIKSSGASGAAAGWVRLFYTYIEMQPDEYWALVESRRIITS